MRSFFGSPFPACLQHYRTLYSWETKQSLLTQLRGEFSSFIYTFPLNWGGPAVWVNENRPVLLALCLLIQTEPDTYFFFIFRKAFRVPVSQICDTYCSHIFNLMYKPGHIYQRINKKGNVAKKWPILHVSSSFKRIKCYKVGQKSPATNLTIFRVGFFFILKNMN